MAKKPDLQPGQYGMKVEYWSTKKTTKWLDVVFSSIREAQDYLENFDPGGDNPNWVGTKIVDWEGNVVGGWGG